MRKVLLAALLAAALAGCAATGEVPPGQAPAAPAPATQSPAPQPAQPPAGSQPPAPQPPATPPPASGGTTPAPPPAGGGIRFNQHEFVPVSPQDLKEPARSWLQTHRDDPAFAVFRDGKDTYLLAAVGQRNTGGYAVTFVSVGDSNGKIEVVVQEQGPKPGQMVTQVITWPVAAVKVVNLPDQPLHFVLTTARGGGAQTYEATVLK